jgi:hypothetical protein
MRSARCHYFRYHHACCRATAFAAVAYAPPCCLPVSSLSPRYADAVTTADRFSLIIILRVADAATPYFDAFVYFSPPPPMIFAGR